MWGGGGMCRWITMDDLRAEECIGKWNSRIKPGRELKEDLKYVFKRGSRDKQYEEDGRQQTKLMTKINKCYTDLFTVSQTKVMHFCKYDRFN